MVQVTLRLDDRLARELKRAAADRGVSVNALASQALAALVDPELAGSEVERLRARFAAAGLLAAPSQGLHPPLPDERTIAEARRAAAHGTPLSDLVSLDRD